MSAVAEQTVIFTFMKNEYLEYIDKLDPSDFAIFFREMEAIKKTREPDGMVNLLKVAEFTGEKISVYAEQMLGVVTCTFLAYYRQVKEKALRTRLAELTNSDVANLEVRKSINNILSEIKVIMQVETPKLSEIEEFEEEMERRRAETTIMLYSIDQLDDVTGGLRRCEFTVLAARPSVGKSAFALQIAENATAMARVMFVSLEMSRVQITERRVLRRSEKIRHEALKSGRLTAGEQQELREIKKKLPENHIEVVDDSYNIDAIKQHVERYKPDLLVIDYIGILKGGGAYRDKRSEIVDLTRSLKLMALEYKMAVLGLAQINRGANERIPTMADLKESGSLEEDADNIILLHRMDGTEKFEGYGPQEIGDIVKTGKQLILIRLNKHRNGELADIMTTYEGKHFRFVEVQ